MFPLNLARLSGSSYDVVIKKKFLHFYQKLINDKNLKNIFFFVNDSWVALKIYTVDVMLSKNNGSQTTEIDRGISWEKSIFFITLV